MTGLIPLTAACLISAAQIQGIPPIALITVLGVEDGKIGMESPNRDRQGQIFSHDLGPMQINDKVWLDDVADMHFQGDRAKARAALRDNGCYNVHIGAWILRQYIDEADGDIYEGIGLYHSHTPKYKERYKAKFRKKFVDLFGPMLGLNNR